MCGYGVVHPLPGIADEFALNTAITLPIGMEAYAAYALGAWLSQGKLRPTARKFAKRSALASLGLGLLGQGAYHLLETLGYVKAPWPVVLFVACLPVLVLGAGATLHHLLSTEDAEQDDQPLVTAEVEVIPETAAPAIAATPAPVVSAPRRPVARRRGKRSQPRRLRADFLAEAREKLAAEPAGVDPSPAWCRTVTGCSERLSTELAKTLRAEVRAPRTGTGTTASTNTRTTGGAGAGTSDLEAAA